MNALRLGLGKLGMVVAVGLLLLVLPTWVTGQSLADSLTRLNTARIHTNLTGLKVLTSWGAANAVSSAAGLLIAEDEEARYFWQMNAAWGVVNGGIGAVGIRGSRRELGGTPGPHGTAVKRYESVRRTFLFNTALDGLYAGAGLYLWSRAEYPSAKNKSRLRGFGKALVLQGAGLAIFDAAMYLAHSRTTAQWYHLINRLSPASAGVGFGYRL